MNLKLKICRIKKGLSQVELARMIGVTNQTISDYERGNSKPSYDNMAKLSKALDSKVDELFFDEEFQQE